jgi:hypothetical protein
MLYPILKSLLLLSTMATTPLLEPGFDPAEYRELMHISARTGAVSNPEYYANIPAAVGRNLTYRSAETGLANLWDLWTGTDLPAVISLRGTIQTGNSWLANIYAAMAPATGSLKLNDSFAFSYKLADNPRAGVHTGWLLSLAYMSGDIRGHIDSLYARGQREFLIIGHSQGGGIAYLLTSWLRHLQIDGKLPTDIRFKTYCSAGPKPGNLYYAYDYERITQDGWGYNVVNAADWVPEVPFSIQTTQDFNAVNPFTDARKMIRKQPLGKRVALGYAYGQLSRPLQRAQRRYEKYLGWMTSKAVSKQLAGFEAPQYLNSNNYTRCGHYTVLTPDSTYYRLYPDDPKNLFPHHLHPQYLYLLDRLRLN